MTPNTPLASTIALRNQLNASYQLYQASKLQFQLCAPNARWYRQYLRTLLWFAKYLYLT